MTRHLKIAGVLIVAVYALVYIDLVLRARTAYQEGEKYMAWHEDPSAKKAFFQTRYEAEVKELEAEKKAGDMPEAEFEQRVELAAFRRDEAAAESSLKYAYHWYKTAAELFSPPESRWVGLAREKVPVAKQMWKRELDSRKIPYEEYMLE